MLAILIAIVFLIVYGSLYPWHFAWRELPGNPVWVMLHSGGAGNASARRFFADIVVNIALYIPLGMAGYLALRRHRYLAPVALGILVSAAVETLQLFTPGRVSSLIDLADNTVGAVLGVFLGVVFETLAGPEVIEFGRITAGHKGALALLFCWVCELLFPLYPETSLHILRAKFAHIAAGPFLTPVPLVSAVVTWYVLGRLLNAAGFQHVRLWLGALLMLLPAQVFVVSRQPEPSDLLGAVLGYAAFCAIGGRKALAQPTAWIFLALLIFRGIAPFHLQPAHEFNWIPFAGFLNTSWQAGIRIMVEKTFYYGTAVWLLRSSGIRIVTATAIVCTVLLLIEIVQTRLPGRVAEITEPFLCALIGFGLWALNPHRRSDAVLLPPVRR